MLQSYHYASFCLQQTKDIILAKEMELKKDFRQGEGG